MRTRTAWTTWGVLVLLIGLAAPAHANDMLGLDTLVWILNGVMLLTIALPIWALVNALVIAFEAAVISSGLRQRYAAAFVWMLAANVASTLFGVILLWLGAEPGWKLAVVDGRPLASVLPRMARSFLATVFLEGLVLHAFTRRVAKPGVAFGAVTLANVLSYAGLVLLMHLVRY